MPQINVSKREWTWQGLKPGNFAFWLSRARPGQKLVYHIGNLAAERAKIMLKPGRRGPTIQTIYRQPLHTVALEVWDAYTQGYVTLVQKRLGENLFQYEAVALGTRAVVVLKDAA